MARHPVLDSTEFQYTDSWTGTKSRLFCVLFAYGYPIDGTRPLMWRVASSPSDSGQHWADFLASLPGKPRVVICDDDTNIKNGVKTHWSRGRPVRIHSGEHHLYKRARNAMDTDKVPRQPAARGPQPRVSQPRGVGGTARQGSGTGLPSIAGVDEGQEPNDGDAAGTTSRDRRVLKRCHRGADQDGPPKDRATSVVFPKPSSNGSLTRDDVTSTEQGGLSRWL